MLRKFTKEFAETLEAELFLKDLPHRYYEENNMHMMIISWIKDYEVCLKEVKKLLPYVNNWATCDLPAPKCFAKHKEELLPEIRNWISSGETYTIRYGIGMLMNLYLEEDFRPEYLKLAADIRSEGILCKHDDRLVSCYGPCKAMGGNHSVYRGTMSAGMGTP